MPVPRSARITTIYTLIFASVWLGLFGCARPAPSSANAPLGTKDCDLERIWFHSRQHTTDMGPSNVSACEAACNHKNGDACVGQGLLLSAGRAVAKNERKAKALFEQECKAKNPDGCLALWRFMLDAQNAVDRDDPARATDHLAHACDDGRVPACDILGGHFINQVARHHKSADKMSAAKYSVMGCNAGSPSGCTNLGWLAVDGDGVPKDEKKAAELFQTQCTAGYMPACTHLGELYKDGIGVSKDIPKALELFRSACAASHPYGCFFIGVTYWKDETPENDEKAVAIFQKTCADGVAPACEGLGHAYTHGKGAKKDLAKAYQYFAMACDDDDALACYYLATMVHEGQGVSPDPAKAAIYFEKACIGGEPASCTWVADFYTKGEGVSKDPVKAEEYLQLGCDRGAMLGCYRLGLMYAHRSSGIPEDFRKAAMLFQKACDGNELIACVELGLSYEIGFGVPRDDLKAVELYEKACDGGVIHGCYSAAWELLHASAIKNETKAIALFQKACDADDHDACGQLGDAYVKGLGVPKDAKKGIGMLDRACQEGSAIACYDLGERYVDGQAGRVDIPKAIEWFDKACPRFIIACHQAQLLRSQHPGNP